MQKYERALLSLLACSMDHDVRRCEAYLPLTELEWAKLLDLVYLHGVSGLVLSVIEHLPKSYVPPKKQLLTLCFVAEKRKQVYQRQFDIASRFAATLYRKGVEMKVLKGISFSTYYDCPELRECGDCDVYLSLQSKNLIFEKTKGDINCSKSGSTGFEVGNRTIVEMGGSREFGSYKHSHLYLDGLMFENHHYITDFNGTRKGKLLELLLERAIDSTPGVQIGDTHMVRPCAYFNALHLIRHAQGNFILEGMTLRMIYDWAVLLRAEQNHLDWGRLNTDFDAYGLRRFADVMTTICVEYLGLHLLNDEVTLCKDKILADKILADTLADNIHMIQNESFVRKVMRIFSRYKRIWRYRELSIESVPMMIWNSLVFSSYMKRKITLD